jgi:hypothetical protein
MNKPSKQAVDAAQKESTQAALPAYQNRMCGTFLLRKGINSMNDIQRARLNKTMADSSTKCNFE